jgi:hypothetical protein
MKLFSRQFPADEDERKRELRDERTRSIIASGMQELARSDLDFQALGGRVIEMCRPASSFASSPATRPIAAPT